VRPAALALLASILPAGCASMPGMAAPRWTLEPRLEWAVMDGRLAMQSPSPSGPVDNAPLGAGSSFGITDRDANIWGRVGFGDGFSGFSFDVMDQEHDSRGKQPEGDFGNLIGPNQSLVETDVDAYRLSFAYHAMLFTFTGIESVTIRGGLGLSVDHESFKLESRRVDGTQTQKINAKDDGVPMARARLDAEYDVFGARVDFGWMEGDFGDIDGRSLDLEISGRYRLSERLAFVAGWKRLDLPLQGRQDLLRYDLDLKSESWFVGLAYTF
jgi:hypothetical protein